MTYGNSLGLRNLSDHDEALLAGIGITSKAQFERLGADKTYLLLLESGHNPDTDLLHRLRGAERDIDWQIEAERDLKRQNTMLLDIDEP